MSELKKLTEEIIRFRNKRNWKQFHNSKDLSLALSIEASELNELFLWKKSEDADKKKIKEELADVLIFAFLIAHNYKFDVFGIIKEKLRINESKYPVKKSRGSARKYSEL